MIRGCKERHKGHLRRNKRNKEGMPEKKVQKGGNIKTIKRKAKEQRKRKEQRSNELARKADGRGERLS